MIDEGDAPSAMRIPIDWALLPDAIAEHSVQFLSTPGSWRVRRNAIASPDRSRSVSSVASICRRMEITFRNHQTGVDFTQLAAYGLQQCRLRARRHGSNRPGDFVSSGL